MPWITDRPVLLVFIVIMASSNQNSPRNVSKKIKSKTLLHFVLIHLLGFTGIHSPVLSMG